MKANTVHGYKVKGSDGKKAMLFFSKAQADGKMSEADLLDINPKEYVKDNSASHAAGHWVGYKRLDMSKDERSSLYAANRKVSFAAALADTVDRGQVLIARARGVDVPAEQAEAVLAMIANIYEQTKQALSPKIKKDKAVAGVKPDKLARFAHLFATR
jgi:hypothetical protein